MIRRALFAFIATAAIYAGAQTVTAAGPGAMLFTDPQYGVSFRYSDAWTFSKRPSFNLPPAISSNASPIRGSVYAKKISGIPSWPDTYFVGAEFSYAAAPVNSPDACKNLANPNGAGGSQVTEQVVGQLTFHHGTSNDAGMGHAVNEDIYTIQHGQTCLLFDLAIHTSSVSGDKTPRPLTKEESDAVKKRLMSILGTVKIEAGR
jgi:hypothetical protein